MTTEEKPYIECNELWPNDAEFFHSGRGNAELLSSVPRLLPGVLLHAFAPQQEAPDHACRVLARSSPAGSFSRPGQRQPKTRRKASLKMHTKAPTTDSEIYTAQQLAELLGCDKETAEARIQQGDLPGVKFGKGWIVPRQAFIERVNEMAKEEAATRRAQLMKCQAEAVKRGESLISSPLLPSSFPIGSRNKRRKPPVLPKLSELELKVN